MDDSKKDHVHDGQCCNGASCEQPGLSQQELEEENAAELPDRENMSLLSANLAAPINAAIAANVASDSSTANAGALQYAPIVENQ